MEHILLIEDNLADIELITSYLNLANFTYRLFKSQSLQDSIEITRHNRIDIILLDLALDDSAGFSTLRLLFQEVHNIPVIVLTGNNNELLGMQIVRAGAQDFLVKGDFESKQLIRAIRYAIRRHKMQMETIEERWKLNTQLQRLNQLGKLAELSEWELDVLAGTMKWSDEMYLLLGYHPQSFPPKLSDYLRIVSTEERELVNAAFQGAIKHGKTFLIEHRAIVNNRLIKDFLIRGQIISEDGSDKILLVGILQDITELKTKEISSKKNNDTNSDSTFKIEHQIFDPINKFFYCIEAFKAKVPGVSKELLLQSEKTLLLFVNIYYQQLNNILLTNTALTPVKTLTPWLEMKNNLNNLIITIQDKHYLDVKWETNVPEMVFLDINLLGLLVYNFINLIPYYDIEKDRFQVHFQVDDVEPTKYEFIIRLKGADTSVAMSKQKKMVERVKRYVQHERSQILEEGLLQNVQAIIKILKYLEGQICFFKKHDIALSIPLEKKMAIGSKIETPTLHRTAKFLIFEHQTILHIAIKRMLQSHFPALQLDFVTSAEVGIQKFAESSYDLLIIDLNLPDVDPKKLLNNLRSRKWTTVFLIGSNLSAENKVQLQELQVEAILDKPLSRETFIPAVSKILEN